MIEGPMQQNFKRAMVDATAFLLSGEGSIRAGHGAITEVWNHNCPTPITNLGKGQYAEEVFIAVPWSTEGERFFRQALEEQEIPFQELSLDRRLVEKGLGKILDRTTALEES